MSMFYTLMANKAWYVIITIMIVGALWYLSTNQLPTLNKDTILEPFNTETNPCHELMKEHLVSEQRRYGVTGDNTIHEFRTFMSVDEIMLYLDRETLGQRFCMNSPVFPVESMLFTLERDTPNAIGVRSHTGVLFCDANMSVC